MLKNDHKVSEMVKAMFGAQAIPGPREMRPRCVLCGKARSGRHRHIGALTKICSRPACQSHLKSAIPDGESLEKLFVLEVHHYFHDEAEMNTMVAQPMLAELSSDNATKKRVEMPESAFRRVTRAMTRQYESSDGECPPVVRRDKKPTLVL